MRMTASTFGSTRHQSVLIARLTGALQLIARYIDEITIEQLTKKKKLEIELSKTRQLLAQHGLSPKNIEAEPEPESTDATADTPEPTPNVTAESDNKPETVDNTASDSDSSEDSEIVDEKEDEVAVDDTAEETPEARWRRTKEALAQKDAGKTTRIATHEPVLPDSAAPLLTPTKQSQNQHHNHNYGQNRNQNQSAYSPPKVAALSPAATKSMSDELHTVKLDNCRLKVGFTSGANLPA